MGEPGSLFVVLSGPSGAGKDAVLDELARRGYRFVITSYSIHYTKLYEA